MTENNKLNLKIERLENFKNFGKGRSGDAAFDLYASEDMEIPAGKIAAISTGIKMEFSEGWLMKIESRSGLALKSYLVTRGGVIDSNYRGEVKVIMKNDKSSGDPEVNGNGSYFVKAGDKIAQIIPIKISEDEFEFVDKVDENTDRGEKGFGSSGK